MRNPLPDIVENGRIQGGKYATRHGEQCGAFTLKVPCGDYARVILADSTDWEKAGLPLPAWEHVSVSFPDRVPTWSEMHQMKKLFFKDDEVVVQFHPAESEYVNCHPYCLHLWRVVGMSFPTPPKQSV